MEYSLFDIPEVNKEFTVSLVVETDVPLNKV